MADGYVVIRNRPGYEPHIIRMGARVTVFPSKEDAENYADHCNGTARDDRVLEALGRWHYTVHPASDYAAEIMVLEIKNG